MAQTAPSPSSEALTPEPPDTDEPLLRAAFLMPISRELERHGKSVEPLLEKHLTPAWRFNNNVQLVPYRNYIAFFEDAAALAEDPFLGLRIGSRFKPENFGPVGVIFRGSPNLRAALSRLVVFLNAQRGGATVEMVIDGPRVEWIFRVNDETIRPRRQEVEFAMGAMAGFIRAMLGPSWAPIEMQFEHSAPAVSPADRQFIHRVFQSRILFDQPANRLVFHARDLARRDLSAAAGQPGPRLERYFREVVAEAAGEDSLAGHVRGLIAERMGNAAITGPALAAQLGLSSRTLQRRLAREGTSARALVQEQRKAVAEAMLRGKDLRITSIAHNLGYADPAVLSRAFKAWSGTSPKGFRQAQG